MPLWLLGCIYDVLTKACMVMGWGSDGILFYRGAGVSSDLGPSSGFTDGVLNLSEAYPNSVEQAAPFLAYEQCDQD